jgi:hypothetical protein
MKRLFVTVAIMAALGTPALAKTKKQQVPMTLTGESTTLPKITQQLLTCDEFRRRLNKLAPRPVPLADFQREDDNT